MNTNNAKCIYYYIVSQENHGFLKAGTNKIDQPVLITFLNIPTNLSQ